MSAYQIFYCCSISRSSKYIYSTPLTSNRQTLSSDFTAYSSHSGGCHRHFLLTLFSPRFLTSILTLPCFCSLRCLLQAHVLPDWEQNDVACSKKVAMWLHCCDPVLSQPIPSNSPLVFNIQSKIQVLWGIEHIFAVFLEASSYFGR